MLRRNLHVQRDRQNRDLFAHSNVLSDGVFARSYDARPQTGSQGKHPQLESYPTFVPFAPIPGICWVRVSIPINKIRILLRLLIYVPKGSVFSSSPSGVEVAHVWSVSDSSVWLCLCDIVQRIKSTHSRPCKIAVMPRHDLAGDRRHYIERPRCVTHLDDFRPT
jgi:hypothetical protein